MFIHSTYRRGRRAGEAFTLAEVLVAVFVVSLLAASLFASYYYGFAIVLRNRTELRANQIMLQRIEDIRLCRWDQLTNLAFSDRYDPTGSATNSIAGGTIYTGTISFTTSNGLPSAADYHDDIYLVTVAVNWTNYSGHQTFPQNRQLQSYVARYGLQNYIFGNTP